MNFVCIVFELGDKMLTLSSMENLIVQCNQNKQAMPNVLQVKFFHCRLTKLVTFCYLIH